MEGGLYTMAEHLGINFVRTEILDDFIFIMIFGDAYLIYIYIHAQPPFTPHMFAGM